jgi:hypothetical protein
MRERATKVKTKALIPGDTPRQEKKGRLNEQAAQV